MVRHLDSASHGVKLIDHPRSIYLVVNLRAPNRSAQQTGEEGSMLHLLWMAIFGLIIGALAKLVMPGKDPGGIWITMLLGIAGSLLATYVLRAVGHYDETQSAGWIASFVGAFVLLGI